MQSQQTGSRLTDVKKGKTNKIETVIIAKQTRRKRLGNTEANTDCNIYRLTVRDRVEKFIKEMSFYQTQRGKQVRVQST